MRSFTILKCIPFPRRSQVRNLLVQVTRAALHGRMSAPFSSTAHAVTRASAHDTPRSTTPTLSRRLNHRPHPRLPPVALPLRSPRPAAPLFRMKSKHFTCFLLELSGLPLALARLAPGLARGTHTTVAQGRRSTGISSSAAATFTLWSPVDVEGLSALVKNVFENNRKLVHPRVQEARDEN